MEDEISTDGNRLQAISPETGALHSAGRFQICFPIACTPAGTPNSWIPDSSSMAEPLPRGAPIRCSTRGTKGPLGRPGSGAAAPRVSDLRAPGGVTKNSRHDNASRDHSLLPCLEASPLLVCVCRPESSVAGRRAGRLIADSCMYLSTSYSPVSTSSQTSRRIQLLQRPLIL